MKDSLCSLDNMFTINLSFRHFLTLEPRYRESRSSLYDIYRSNYIQRHIVCKSLQSSSYTLTVTQLGLDVRALLGRLMESKQMMNDSKLSASRSSNNRVSI